MIITGYPGIGKTTLAKKDNVIDLESSLFKSMPNWANSYITIANYLSNQGKVVMVSSHPEVLEEIILNSKNAYLIYPSLELKNEWINKVGHRLLINTNQKNLRAYERVKYYYDEDIKTLKKYNISKCELNDMEYSLVDIVNGIE